MNDLAADGGDYEGDVSDSPLGDRGLALGDLPDEGDESDSPLGDGSLQLGDLPADDLPEASATHKMSWEIQDDNPDSKVQVREGFHRDTQERISEFLVHEKSTGEHIHTGMNEDGKVVFENDWKKDH